MKKRLILAAAFAILAFNLIFKVRADLSSSDLGLSQRIFRESINKGVLLCNSFMAYADSEWEQSGPGRKVWDKAWQILPVITLVENDFKENAYLSEYLQNNDSEITPLEAAVLAENEAANEVVNEALGETTEETSYEFTEFIPADATHSVFSMQQLQ